MNLKKNSSLSFFNLCACNIVTTQKELQNNVLSAFRKINNNKNSSAEHCK